MSEQVKSGLMVALAKARLEFGPIKKDSANPFFKSKYANLEAYIEATAPVLAKHGIVVAQDTRTTWEGAVPRVEVQTSLYHGETSEGLHGGWYPVLTSKGDAQGLGAGLTYARRYSYGAALCLAAEDDDGNAASAPQKVRGGTKSEPVDLDAPAVDPNALTQQEKLSLGGLLAQIYPKLDKAARGARLADWTKNLLGLEDPAKMDRDGLRIVMEALEEERGDSHE